MSVGNFHENIDLTARKSSSPAVKTELAKSSFGEKLERTSEPFGLLFDFCRQPQPLQAEPNGPSADRLPLHQISAKSIIIYINLSIIKSVYYLSVWLTDLDLYTDLRIGFLICYIELILGPICIKDTLEEIHRNSFLWKGFSKCCLE